MTHILQHLRRLLHNSRGSSMLEFALGAGILVTVFTSTFQYGYTFYQYNALVNAVNNGARYAAVREYDSASSTPSTAFATAVKNVVVFGDPAGGSTPVVPGLATSNVSLTVTFANGIPTAMTVSITNFALGAVVGTTTLNTKPVFTYPYVGLYSPA